MPHHFQGGTHLAGMLLLTLLLAVPGTAHAGSGRSPASVTGSVGRSKGLESMEGDWGAAAPSTSSAPKFGGGTSKSGQSGYSAQRVQRFWSHYHGNRREPKQRPLERTH